MKKIIALSLWLASIATLANAAETPPKGSKPIATCRDGGTYYSTSGDHRGACSGHGGVAAWADGSPVHSGGRTTGYKAKGAK